ncbi:MAG: hypothetical protein WCK96_00185 [Methylococcales bacterium]
MAEEKDSSNSRHNGSSETYFSENFPKQLDFWTQSAKQGQSIAQTLLGGCYYFGNQQRGLFIDDTDDYAECSTPDKAVQRR